MNFTTLTQDIDFICSTDSTSYPNTDKARNINKWYYVAVIERINSLGKWQFDDSNHTTLPKTTTTLVADQRDYTLPTTLLKLDTVDILDSSGNYVRIEQRDEREQETPLDEMYDTSGMPLFYDAIGNSILLYPAASATDTTLTKGLRLNYQRDFDGFTSTDTTQTPSLETAFHPILSYGGSYEWFVSQGDSKRAQSVRVEIEALLKRMKETVSQKDTSEKVRVQPAHNQQLYL